MLGMHEQKGKHLLSTESNIWLTASWNDKKKSYFMLSDIFLLKHPIYYAFNKEEVRSILCTSQS